MKNPRLHVVAPWRALASLLLIMGLSAPAAAFDFDIDQDGQAQPLTDGLLVIRYLFGFSGSALTNGAIADGAERPLAADIESYLAENSDYLDIDDDGKAMPLTDGLLIIRYLFGFSGDALVSGAIASDANVRLAPEVQDRLDAVKSGLGGSNLLADLDGDGLPNAQDPDDDNDGVLDVDDAYSKIALGGLVDTDGDGRPNVCDAACVALGMAADPDSDNDGVLDGNDGYPLIALGTLTDSDGDGRPNDCGAACTALGMAADLDDDADGILDVADAYALISLGGLTDADGDGRPDVCDPACQAAGMTVDFDIDNDGVLDPIYPIESSFNVQAVVIADHVDGRAKPAFYHLSPRVQTQTLSLDLGGNAIDLSHLKSAFEEVPSDVDSVRVLYLLDRVPVAGSRGSFEFEMVLLDGSDGQRDSEERSLKTAFILDWSSDGEVIELSAPVQDQVLTLTSGLIVERTLSSVQPRIMTARKAVEYPGYPAVIEIKPLEFFDASLFASAKELGLFDLIQSYFDTVKTYHLTVDLKATGDGSQSVLGYQGAAFDRVETKLTIDEVALGSGDGFNLTRPTDAVSVDALGYALMLAGGGDARPAWGLFAGAGDDSLVVQAPPGYYVEASWLNEQAASVDALLAVQAYLEGLPEAAEILTVVVTWTEGADALRVGDERQLVAMLPLQFKPDSVNPGFVIDSEGASLTRSDGAACQESGACLLAGLQGLASSLSILPAERDLPRQLSIGLLPFAGLAEAAELQSNFFRAGDYHLKIEFNARSGLVSYEQHAVQVIEGVLTVR